MSYPTSRLPATVAVLLLVILVAASPAGCRRRDRIRAPETSNSSQGSQSDTRETLQSGGRVRTYLVHLPSGYREGKQLPLVIVLHGGTGNAEHTERTTGLNSTADKNGFIVVYPDGTGGEESANDLMWEFFAGHPKE